MTNEPDKTAERKTFVCELYRYLLNRSPRPAEESHWIDALARGMPERELFHRFVNGKEYAAGHRVVPGFPDGHFYSPVVDPTEVKDYWGKSSALQAKDLRGITIDIAAMTAFWNAQYPAMRNMQYPALATDSHRYFSSDGRYPKGDALVLAGMISAARPRRIIEIGSGFSSAAMLDTLDVLGIGDCHLTCIDPYADRLRSLLRPQDHARVTIVEQQVQTVPIETFSSLEASDILFIDSSHVLKTGSDVHYELFSILPQIASGVLVHFHDIQFPFEYPAQWIFNKRWSWNEIYAVRAFLMFNDNFRVKFFTDYFLREQGALVAETLQEPAPLIGGSLWIERS